MIRQLVVLLVLGAGASQAQSTERVGHPERKLQFELSGGVGPSDATSGEMAGRTGAGSVALRWDADGSGGLRIALWGSQNHSTYYYNIYDNSNSARRDSVVHSELQIAVVASADIGIRLWRDLLVSGSIGGGYLPYAHSDVSYGTLQNPYQYYSGHGSNFLLTGSVGVRYRWLLVEQHAMLVQGGSSGLGRGRSFYPLMVGFRFM